jgi:chromatin remodeling complex protein RSC6
MAKTINPALSKPLQPQPKLAAVVGNAPLARSEAIKKV